MSNFQKIFKTFIEKNSNSLSFLKYIPFSVRLGRKYKEHQKLIDWYENLNEDERKRFHYEKLKKILDFSYSKIPFYRDFYQSKNYNPKKFLKFEDFLDVPIVSKQDLKKYSLEKRSLKLYNSEISNTGGTSGNPLNFRIDANTFSREWAYMHKIWRRLDYRHSDIKLTFRGKNLGPEPIKYNLIHNEYIVNAYLNYDLILEKLEKISLHNDIKFIHGYPSSIYEFCKYLKEKSYDAGNSFLKDLKGVFLGSEFPAPVYRNFIEDYLQVPAIAWYGHSEFAILAPEISPYVFSPFQTYGLAEAIDEESNSKKEFKLLATGYYNFASPFIRYDTEDMIKNPVIENNILQRFEISSGRIGDFILDKNNKKISLTALIFGRHHLAFGKADFIQISSDSKGQASLLVTSKNEVKLSDFDLTNVQIDFNLKILKKPIKTKNGKLPLLVKNQ